MSVEAVSKPDCVVATFARTWGFRWSAHVLANVATVLAVLAGVAHGDEKADEAYRASQLQRMKSIAEKFEVEAALGAKPVAAKLLPNPLLRYNDSTRRNNESTLWLWTERELPCALMAVEFYPNSPSGPRWLFEIVSLSNSKIGVARGGDWKWQAKQPGVIRKPVPGDLTPAEKPALRLSQARQIRQRFAAHEKEGTGGRVELRPLSTPLYRYADEQTGVIDGAVFAFANGTNPEVLLLLEAQRDAATKAAISGPPHLILPVSMGNSFSHALKTAHEINNTCKNRRKSWMN